MSLNREKLHIILEKTENVFWGAQKLVWNIKNKDEKALLDKNEELKDVHYGELCFILGNGPSLKDETRLEELANYQVFTVNQFYRSELFNIVKPNYHVMIDPIFFKLDDSNPNECDTLSRMKKVSEDTSLHMILSVDFYSYINRHLSRADSHYYVKNRYKMTENYKKEIDMSSYLPASYNVIQTAIYCAIYMGFKKIVLLGCDMTGILDNYVKYSTDGDTEHFSHVYEYTAEEKKRMQKVHAEHSNECMLLGFYNMFRDFRLINEICKKKNIQIYNATGNTALDMIEHVCLDDVLNKMV